MRLTENKTGRTGFDRYGFLLARIRTDLFIDFDAAENS